MANIKGFDKFSEHLANYGKNLSMDKNLSLKKNSLEQPEKESQGKSSFADMLKDTIKEVNGHQKVADKMATEVATGKNDNIQETMLAMAQAELSFNLMVQVRNKALEAYQEIMRMPVW